MKTIFCLQYNVTVKYFNFSNKQIKNVLKEKLFETLVTYVSMLIVYQLQKLLVPLHIHCHKSSAFRSKIHVHSRPFDRSTSKPSVDCMDRKRFFKVSDDADISLAQRSVEPFLSSPRALFHIYLHKRVNICWRASAVAYFPRREKSLTRLHRGVPFAGVQICLLFHETRGPNRFEVGRFTHHNQTVTCNL